MTTTGANANFKNIKNGNYFLHGHELNVKQSLISIVYKLIKEDYTTPRMVKTNFKYELAGNITVPF